jgi:hypothetical protein
MIKGKPTMKRKLIIGILSVLALIGLAGTFWGSSLVTTAGGIWGSCTKGRINCPYPGECNSYIDTNNDNICDRSQAEPAAASNQTTTMSTSSTVTTTPSVTATVSNRTIRKTSYYFIPIAAGLIVLYALTWILSAAKKIKQVTHRRIWNIVLGVSGLVSAVLGLLLLLNLDLGLSITLPFDMLYWHVEAGIALGIIAIFHIGWHWRYFAKLVGK